MASPKIKGQRIINVKHPKRPLRERVSDNELNKLTDKYIKRGGVYIDSTNECKSIDKVDNFTFDFIKAVIGNFEGTPHQLDMYTTNCEMGPLNWTTTVEDYDGFRFPSFNIPDRPIFHETFFYSRGNVPYFTTESFNKLMRDLKGQGLCSITSSLNIAKTRKVGMDCIDWEGNKYCANKGNLFFVKDEVKDALKNCGKNSMIIIPTSWNFTSGGAHAVSYIIYNGTIEPYNPHGTSGKFGRENLHERYGRFLANKLNLKYKEYNECNYKGIQLIENGFFINHVSKRKSKFLKSRYKDSRTMTGNCYLWNILQMFARVCNPSLPPREVSKRLKNFLNTSNSAELFEDLYKIIKSQ